MRKNIGCQPIVNVGAISFPTFKIPLNYEFKSIGLNGELIWQVYNIQNLTLHTEYAFLSYNLRGKEWLIMESQDLFVERYIEKFRKPIFQSNPVPIEEYDFGKPAFLLIYPGRIFNYAHFVFDNLFRLLLLLSNNRFDGVVIYSKALPGFALEYLELICQAFNLEKKEIPIGQTMRILSDVLVFSGHRYVGYHHTIHPSSFYSDLPDYFSSRLNFLKEEKSCHGRYIFIARRNTRIIDNEKELCSKFPFLSKMILEEISVKDAILAFHSAKIVIAAHGAGLSNLIYCKPKTVVIELLQSNAPTLRKHLFYILSEVRQLNYYEVICGPVSNGVSAKDGLKFTANLDKISNLFDSLNLDTKV